MKTIVTACGVGFASSTIIAERIKAILEREGMTDQVRIIQCTLNEVPGYIDRADCIVTSSKVYGEYPIPVLNGVAFISGIGMEQLDKQIVEILKQ
ncbi:MAG: PTS sugar transporter subunit IIB [Oscillospiraceae bacterium]|nr:PTS sugar transporter subunit IIB [Oscillospiraceae bacterium]